MVACAVVTSLTVVAQAQEFHALGGARRYPDVHDTDYAWQIEYMQPIKNCFAWSFSYLNEGHTERHHRDGAIAQIWVRTAESQAGLSAAAGAGVYRYFDTAPQSGTTYSNSHGWAAVTSAAGAWRVCGPWLAELRANWVHAEHDANTVSVLAGFGYRFGASAPLEKHRGEERMPGNEVTLFLGQSVLNSFGSEAGFSQGLEYRRHLGRFLQWTASILHEGNNGRHQRTGAAGQLWAGRAFFDGRLSLGFGAGPYFTVDTHGGDRDNVFGIFTVSAAYRLATHWGVRFSWNRVGTNCNSDSDIFLGGIAYLF
jgi:hypothetical protein